jgi:zinc protease
MLRADDSDHVDPGLFTVFARVKKDADIDGVRDSIVAAADGFKEQLVPAARLEAVKKHLRYSFALGLNNSEAVAQTAARYVELRRTPETINRLYEVYDSVTPEDIQAAARKYLVTDGRTIVTLTGGKAK